MEHFYHDQNGPVKVMTIDQLRQICPNFPISDDGNENVIIMSANGMEYPEGQVIFDAATGQQLQIGYHQGNAQIHQQQILTVVQQPEPMESSGPTMESMETQTIPMANHQIIYHQQQHGQLEQLAQQQIQQQMEEQQRHQQLQQHLEQERLKQQQAQQQEMQRQQQMHQELQIQQQQIQQQQLHQQQQLQHLQQQQMQQQLQGQQIQLVQQQEQQLQMQEQPQLEHHIIVQQKLQLMQHQAQEHESPKEEQLKVTQMQLEQHKIGQLQQQQLQQEQVIQRHCINESNGYVMVNQETVQMRLETQQLSVQVDGHQQLALLLPGGRKVPLRDWRKPPTNRVSTIQAAPNHVPVVRSPVMTNHVSTIRTTANHVSPIRSPVNVMVSNHMQDGSTNTTMRPTVLYRPTRPSYSYRNANSNAVPRPPALATTTNFVSAQRPAYTYRSTNPSPRQPMLMATPGVDSNQRPAVMNNVVRKAVAPRRAQTGGRRGTGRGRYRYAPDGLTEQELQMQAEATAQLILNAHRQSEAAKRAQHQQMQQDQQQQRTVIRQVQRQPVPQRTPVMRPEAPPIKPPPPPPAPPKEEGGSEGPPASVIIIMPDGQQITVDNSRGLSIPQVLSEYGIVTENFQVIESFTELTPEQEQSVSLMEDIPLHLPIAEEHTVPQPIKEEHIVSQPMSDEHCSSQRSSSEAIVTEEVPSVNGQTLQESVVNSAGIRVKLTPMTASEQRAEEQREIASSLDPVVELAPAKKDPLPFRTVPGMLALCQLCGYSSVNFNECQRCKRLLPPDVKHIAASSSERRKPPQLVKEDTASESSPAPFKSATPAPGKTLPPIFIEVPLPAKIIRKRLPLRRPKLKQPEEPVLLTLSSDDESAEGEAAPPPLLFSNPGTLQVSVSSASSTARRKEPPVALADEGCAACSQYAGVAHNLELEKMMDGSDSDQFVVLSCRTVRIGSYKTVPKDKLVISHKGIKIVVPHIGDENSRVTLVLTTDEVTKVLIHYGKMMPVLFVYAKSCAGTRWRDQLQMSDRLCTYIPNGSENNRRITILPTRIPELTKILMRDMFSDTVYGELTHSEANDILMRCSPIMSARVPPLVKHPAKSSVRQIMVYPPPPETGGISINTEDYSCLGAMQFLNDVIIDFYLKYLALSVLSEADRKRTHIFSTFFYKRLTTRPKKNKKSTIEEDPKLTAAEKRHFRVKSWTKKVNIFEKDFVIIPINEHSHWFLAIICFPGLTSPVRISDEAPVAVQPSLLTYRRPAKVRPVAKLEIKPVVALEPGEILPTMPLELSADSSDRDEADEEEEDLEQSDDEDLPATGESSDQPPSEAVPAPQESTPAVPEASPSPPKPRKQPSRTTTEPIKQPCILIFDSLGGTSRAKIVATLRDYLRIEYKAKMKVDRDFNKDTIKGGVPKVPQQNNFYDCGLYVLQYVESFFNTPVQNYNLPIRDLATWFDDDVVNRKREDLATLLKRLMKENNIDVDKVDLPHLAFAVDCSDPPSESQETGEETIQASETIYTEETNVAELMEEATEEPSHPTFDSVFMVEVPREEKEADEAMEVPAEEEEEEEEETEDQKTTKFLMMKRLVHDQDILQTKAKRIKSARDVSE